MELLANLIMVLLTSLGVTAEHTAEPVTSLSCYVEEGGEVIAYPEGIAPRPGFYRIPCSDVPMPDANGCTILAGHVDVDSNGYDRLVEAEGTGPFDYQGMSTEAQQMGAWVAEGGDGRVVGYAVAEDSSIWSTEACAASEGESAV